MGLASKLAAAQANQAGGAPGGAPSGAPPPPQQQQQSYGQPQQQSQQYGQPQQQQYGQQASTQSYGAPPGPPPTGARCVIPLEYSKGGKR